MTTLEEVRKAYEDLSDEDKENFRQSVSDRVHESIAAQERADGDEDTQTAADREHEALGAEHADERRDDAQDARQDAHEDSDRNMYGEILDRLAALEKAIADGKEKPEDKREKYGMSAKPFPAAPRKEYTDADVDRLLG